MDNLLMVQVMMEKPECLQRADELAEKIYDFVTEELKLEPDEAFNSMTTAIGFMIARASDNPPDKELIELFIQSIVLSYAQEIEMMKTRVKPN